MDQTQFLDVLSVLEREMQRRGLTLDQIKAIEIDAFALSQDEFNQGVEEYLRTVVRLSNSELFIGKGHTMTGNEMLSKIAQREYPKESEHIDKVDCMIYAAIWLIIAAGLLSIAGNLYRLWQSFAI